jgi:hypothetical protein
LPETKFPRGELDRQLWPPAIGCHGATDRTRPGHAAPPHHKGVFMNCAVPDQELLDLVVRLVEHLDPPPGHLVERIQSHLDAAR